ncbi:MAG TPA: hypothetical protein VEQ41_07760 [Solirubrobacterales bacterium]|nr:hypothetical protein [Solirubrobacterales bacterium]
MFKPPRSQQANPQGQPPGQERERSPDATGGEGKTSPRTVRQVRERDEPAPSHIWQVLSGNFAAFSFAVGLAALTLADNLGVRASELWLSSAFLAVLAVVCGFAHWDANRGRRTRSRRVEEEAVPDHG